jgi:hypothetical protein
MKIDLHPVIREALEDVRVGRTYTSMSVAACR